METFSALLALCAGNSPVTSEFPAQRPVTRSFDVFLHLRLDKWFSKQSWGWWFATSSRTLWLHCNDIARDMETIYTLFCINFHQCQWISRKYIDELITLTSASQEMWSPFVLLCCGLLWVYVHPLEEHRQINHIIHSLTIMLIYI